MQDVWDPEVDADEDLDTSSEIEEDIEENLEVLEVPANPSEDSKLHGAPADDGNPKAEVHDENHDFAAAAQDEPLDMALKQRKARK